MTHATVHSVIREVTKLKIGDLSSITAFYHSITIAITFQAQNFSNVKSHSTRYLVTFLGTRLTVCLRIGFVSIIPTFIPAKPTKSFIMENSLARLWRNFVNCSMVFPENEWIYNRFEFKIGLWVSHLSDIVFLMLHVVDSWANALLTCSRLDSEFVDNNSSPPECNLSISIPHHVRCDAGQRNCLWMWTIDHVAIKNLSNLTRNCDVSECVTMETDANDSPSAQFVCRPSKTFLIFFRCNFDRCTTSWWTVWGSPDSNNLFFRNCANSSVAASCLGDSMFALIAQARSSIVFKWDSLWAMTRQ